MVDLPPFASQVGLQPAAAALDAFLPDRATHDLDSIRGNFPTRPGGRITAREPSQISQLLRSLADDPDAVALVNATWDSWQQHRLSFPYRQWWQRRYSNRGMPVTAPDDLTGMSPVQIAVIAEQQKVIWQARRQIENSPTNRKQVRQWSQLLSDNHSTAVGLADRHAAALSDAAQSVTTPSHVTRKVVPSWR